MDHCWGIVRALVDMLLKQVRGVSGLGQGCSGYAPNGSRGKGQGLERESLPQMRGHGRGGCGATTRSSPQAGPHLLAAWPIPMPLFTPAGGRQVPAGQGPHEGAAQVGRGISDSLEGSEVLDRVLEGEGREGGSQAGEAGGTETKSITGLIMFAIDLAGEALASCHPKRPSSGMGPMLTSCNPAPALPAQAVRYPRRRLCSGGQLC